MNFSGEGGPQNCTHARAMAYSCQIQGIFPSANTHKFPQDRKQNQ